ncbi:MAG TPA: hypothetical protein VMF67_03790 [Rhizomicrobium sp.]|nr:hypothetical protein [Rhizomicrobium sp.]
MQGKTVLAAELPVPESVLLWSMRAWVIGHCRRLDVSSRIERVLAQLGASEAAHDLNGFMWALRQGALRTIEINCVCHPEVSLDEGMLLALFALQQQEDHDDAYTVLSGLVTERAAIAASESSQRVALLFAVAGNSLSTLSFIRVRSLAEHASTRRAGYLH